MKGIGDGDCVSAIAQQAQLASTWSAFALWCSGGDRVVTWGTWAKIQAKGWGVDEMHIILSIGGGHAFHS